MIDLHVHTNMSDGQYAPSEVVRLAAKRGVSVMSITDHDTISGIEEGSSAAFENGICFIPGMEISVKGCDDLHILGYCIDIHNENVLSMCESLIRLRKQREARIFAYLKQRGLELSREQVEKHAHSGVVGRPHFARAMVEAGYVNDVREAFLLHLSTPEFKKIERPKPEASEGIAAISKGGGVAVLAHPLHLKLSDEDLESLIKRLKGYGLMGIECHYSTHSRSRTAYYINLSKKYDLLVTGGSDYHGETMKPDIKIGSGINNSLCFNDDFIYEKLYEAASRINLRPTPS